MSSKECELQLNQLIIDWDEDRATRINATDIDAMKHLMLENQVQQDTIKTQKFVIDNLSERINNSIERLEALIIFWKKYNPIDNTMQVGQFEGVIEILKGETNEK